LPHAVITVLVAHTGSDLAALWRRHGGISHFMSTGWTTPAVAKTITLAIINRSPDHGQSLEALSTCFG
jgi:hypothetical protein